MLRLSLRWKLLGLVFGLCTAIAGLGWFGQGRLARSEADLDLFADRVVPALEAMDQMDAALATAMFHARRALAGNYSGEPELVRKARADHAAALQRFEAGFRVYESIEKEDARAAWDAFVEADRALPGGFAAVFAAIDRGEKEGAEAAWDAQLKPAYGLVAQRMNELVHATTALADRYRTQAREAAAAGRRAMVAAVLLVVVLAGALGVALVLAITRPIERLTRAAAEIARGDLDQEIEHRSHDEIGRLADSFRDLCAYLRDVAAAADAMGRGVVDHEIRPRSPRDVLSRSVARTGAALRGVLEESGRLIEAARAGRLATRADVSRFEGAFGALARGMNGMLAAVERPVADTLAVLERMAHRDLSARIEGAYENDFGRLTAAANGAGDALREALAQVAAAAEQVSAAAEQIAAGSQAVARGASAQAGAIERTGAALEELSATTGHNANSAREADGLARGARAASEHGRTAMVELSRAMERIRGAAEATAAIIRDIDEIAFQTNLLALNAAVEAARAGEQGRGFAVVAEEVRSLALRSKEAAKRTEALIQESVSLAQGGEGVSRKVDGSFDELVGTVGKVATIVTEIAGASAEQERGIAQVVKGVAAMEGVTRQNSATSEESAAAAEELSSQAEELQTMLSSFRLDGAVPEGAGTRAA
jgi:methyl-accepting chemotaxis protein